MPTVTMSPSPLFMGSVLNASDFGSSHVFGAGHGTNASQSHHVHAHQFYSVGQFVPMVNAHPMNPGERQNSIPQATAHSQKIAVPGMFPLTYGVLGNGVFDHGMFAGHVNQTRFPTNVYPSQPQPITSPPVRASEIPSNHCFLHVGPHTEARHAERSTTLRQVHQTPSLHGRETKEEVDEHISAAPLKVSHAATSGRIVKDARSSHRIGGQEQRVSNAPRTLCSRFQVPGQTTSPTQAVPLTHAYRNAYGRKKVSGTGTSQHNRVNAKSSSKPKSSSRAKRTRHTQGLNSRGKNDGTRLSKERPSGNGPSSNRKSGDGASGETGTTPKNRQQILQTVLDSEDHEYGGFALYLSETYEFTGSTNWQISRGYARLCDLKDDYHKKCSTQEVKLKIYRVKGFFSKVLKLEVTGEWDKRNHGGVRGPYVYGIHLKQDTAPQTK
ncbi:hypothetical protein FGB62_290g06 [Gracilaria domingensis]|nr:hypothetical protein FGB62_290g06 [Gracilaria domingensis]